MMYINLEALKNIDFQNRYDAQKFIPYSENVYDILDSYFARKVRSLPIKGTVTVRGETSRPDLLSYRIYGSTMYWYILMLYNDRVEVSEFNEGDIIKYPAIDSLEEEYFSLNAKQRGSGNTGVVG